MASGTFPLPSTDSDAKKLLEAKKILEDFRSEYYEIIYSGDSGGCQYDNAASDGGYLERISIAIEMINGCIYTKDSAGNKTLIK
jgi:hypothetical protein